MILRDTVKPSHNLFIDVGPLSCDSWVSRFVDTGPFFSEDYLTFCIEEITIGRNKDLEKSYKQI